MQTIKEKGERIANSILNTFEYKNCILTFPNNSHLMIRLYRTTKNRMFVNPIVEAILIEKEMIINDFMNLDNKEYINRRSLELFTKLKSTHGTKASRRAKLFNSCKEHLFYHHIIHELYLFKTLGLDKSKFREYFNRGIAFIKKLSRKTEFINAFFDKNMIMDFGAQLVNCAHYLKSLNIINITKKVTARFNNVFSNRKDNTLSKYLYKNKIYGMTHFIIAGSDYYQKYVPKKNSAGFSRTSGRTSKK